MTASRLPPVRGHYAEKAEPAQGFARAGRQRYIKAAAQIFKCRNCFGPPGRAWFRTPGSGFPRLPAAWADFRPQAGAGRQTLYSLTIQGDSPILTLLSAAVQRRAGRLAPGLPADFAACCSFLPPWRCLRLHGFDLRKIPETDGRDGCPLSPSPGVLQISLGLPGSLSRPGAAEKVRSGSRGNRGTAGEYRTRNRTVRGLAARL